jgi:hypothetical protein
MVSVCAAEVVLTTEVMSVALEWGMWLCPDERALGGWKSFGFGV